MRLNSSPLNSAFSPDHPYVLQQIRHETEAWNNISNRRYDRFRLQTIKLYHFHWISVCFICRFPLRLTHSLHSFPYPFRFFNDSADRCEWSLPFKRVRLGEGVHRAPRNLHLVAQVLPNPKINFEPWKCILVSTNPAIPKITNFSEDNSYLLKVEASIALTLRCTDRMMSVEQSSVFYLFSNGLAVINKTPEVMCS